MTWPNNHKVYGAVFGLLAICLLFHGCAGTVTPRIVSERVASFDGTNQNSGFIGYAPDGSGILTVHARDRYNGLIATYGGNFIPPLKPDDGIVATGTNTFLIDPGHLAYFAEMNRARKSGQ